MDMGSQAMSQTQHHVKGFPDAITYVMVSCNEILKYSTDRVSIQLYCILFQVILCANSKPALNDVTFSELTILMKRISNISDHVAMVLTSGQLMVMESGQGSPCLDLR